MAKSQKLRGQNVGDKVAVEPKAKAAPAVAAKPAAKNYSAQKKETQEDREKLLSERFVPETVAYLKDSLNIDLNDLSFPRSKVYDIALGNLIGPTDVVVTPKVFDKEAGHVVDAKPIKACVSLMITLPHDKEFKPVKPTEKNPVRIYSYPCVDYVEKADKSESISAPVKVADERPNPSFTESQKKALAGIGITDDRLFGGFNAFSKDAKYDMLEGRYFGYSGYVRTDFGGLNVSGTGVLKTSKDGRAVAEFETTRPLKEEEKKNLLPDIMEICKSGNVEYGLFKTDSNGKVITTVDNVPILNQAGKDLCEYGMAFEMVDATIHSKVTNENGEKVNSYEKTKYQVMLVEGGIFAKPVVKVDEYNEDGTQKTVRIGGKECPKYHYEMNTKISEDGTVRVQNPDTKKMESLQFVSDEEREAYKRGLGKVKDATFVVNGKAAKYDLYAFPDPRRNGFATVLSPYKTEKLDKRKAEQQAKTVRKKQNFSQGI